MSKLYPPIIPGTLPAFYGTVTNITVPFSMNKAVNTNEISGFSLKIKTAYSNTLLGTLEYPKVENGQRASIDSKIFSLNKIVFEEQNIASLNIKPGQFLKAQLAYIDSDNIIGYYSTVGIIKYTDKPTLTINEFEFENNSNEDDSNKIRTFCSTCTGVYTPGEEDVSERPYQYQFLLYNENDQIIEDSNWLLHNNEQDIGDIYTFKSKMDTLTVYQVQYNVKTINNLEVSSKKYKCLIPEEEINNPLILKAENIYEEGYINLSFSKVGSLENSQIIDIYREEYGTNNQCFIHRIQINNSNVSDWNFQDFTIEQGISYLYYFKYNINGYHSQICGDENGNPIEVIADFEDMFLYDGQKQIKLRFNPKVSSFKINHLEQKTDVIGNRYPIFFRNSIVEYKEFPISGLISYYLDDNELFIQDSLQELGIQRNILERLGTHHDYGENSPFSTEQGKYFNSQPSSVKSLNLISNNIKAERLFKMKLLDWLGNGEIKLFKSPSEGNYLVRLMNISLSPEDKLNRMLHTFSCTAYEAKEFNFENLEELGFINIDQNIQIKTINKNIYYLKKDVEFYPGIINDMSNPLSWTNPQYSLDIINSNEKIVKSNIYLYKKEIIEVTSFQNIDIDKNKIYTQNYTEYRSQYYNNSTEEYQIEARVNNKNYPISDNLDSITAIQNLDSQAQESEIKQNYPQNSCSIYTKFNNPFSSSEVSPSGYLGLNDGEIETQYQATKCAFYLEGEQNKKFLSPEDIKKYLTFWTYTKGSYTTNNKFTLGSCVYLKGNYIIRVNNTSQESGDSQ